MRSRTLEELVGKHCDRNRTATRFSELRYGENDARTELSERCRRCGRHANQRLGSIGRLRMSLRHLRFPSIVARDITSSVTRKHTKSYAAAPSGTFTCRTSVAAYTVPKTKSASSPGPATRLDAWEAKSGSWIAPDDSKQLTLTLTAPRSERCRPQWV